MIMILDAVKEQYRRLWGEPSRTAQFRFSGHKVEVLKSNADTNPEQVNMYATVGASADVPAGYPSDHRVEFYVGLKPERDDVARPLAMLAFEAIVNRVEVGHGHSVTFSESLWSGTRMTGFLVLRPVVEVVPTLHLPDGVHVEFLQAIPVFESEVSFKAERRAEGLLEHWKAAGLAFWDPDRRAEPRQIESKQV
jgi:hypothetical protein